MSATFYSPRIQGNLEHTLAGMRKLALGPRIGPWKTRQQPNRSRAGRRHRRWHRTSANRAQTYGLNTRTIGRGVAGTHWGCNRCVLVLVCAFFFFFSCSVFVLVFGVCFLFVLLCSAVVFCLLLACFASCFDLFFSYFGCLLVSFRLCGCFAPLLRWHRTSANRAQPYGLNTRKIGRGVAGTHGGCNRCVRDAGGDFGDLFFISFLQSAQTDLLVMCGVLSFSWRVPGL